MDSLATLTETSGGEIEVPSSRIKDAKNAYDIYERMKQDDDLSSQNRAMCHAMRDGEPPYSQTELKRLGQGDRCNLNWGQADAAHEGAVAGYLDLTNSVDVMFRCHTTFGDESQKVDYGNIISEEYHKLLKNDWDCFEYNFQRLVSTFVDDGVGLGYYENAKDWRWNVSGLDNFKVPRGTKANEQDIEVSAIAKVIKPHALYNYIRNENIAKELGWNVNFVKEVLVKSSSSSKKSVSSFDWEDYQREIKDNDVYLGYGKGDEGIKIVILNVQEFSGKVTQMIVAEDFPSEFLYIKRDKFSNIRQCFTLFPYGIGNGDIHSIRGLLYKIFRHVQINNRLMCHLVDGTILSTAILVQPTDAEDMENLNLTYFGPYAVAHPNLRVVERNIPNMSANVLPVVRELGMQMSNQTNLYQAQALPQSNVEQTKFEVQTRLQHSAILSVAAMNLFYNPWGKLANEQFRRIKDPHYRREDPGGVEVNEFKIRCKKRGVPLEAIEKVDRVSPVRAVGYGSPGVRLVAFDEFMQMIGAFDEQGRNNVLRDRVASRVGWEQVDRYVPKITTSNRQPTDEKIAIMENADFEQGKQLPVLAGENHAVHARIHLSGMTQAIQMYQQQQYPPQTLLMLLMASVPHTQQHLQQLSSDVTRLEEVKQANKILQQYGALAQQLQQQAMEAAQAQQAQAQPSIDPKAQAELAKTQAKIQLDTAVTDNKMKLKAIETNQRMALRDAQTAQKMRDKRKK